MRCQPKSPPLENLPLPKALIRCMSHEPTAQFPVAEKMILPGVDMRVRNEIDERRLRLFGHSPRGSIKGPISVPVSPLSAVECYPCREVPLNYNRSLLFHGGNTGSTPVRDANTFPSFAAVLRS